MDEAILVLRLILATTLFAHATQKLLGWFQGAGIGRSADLFEALGHQPAKLMVMLAGATELGAALLFATGFLFPVAVVMGGATLFVAAHALILRSGKFWNSAGGGEFPFVLAVMCCAIGIAGPGRWSMDRWWDVPWSDASYLTGIIAIVLAVCGALLPVVRARKVVRARAHEQRMS
ncbi:DoxX family protein [Leucobacter denitrificans]|uniref:DoxX family protein n=1 Tax=Leucobacter denitrificans TaxID=683042 RepID=A0A7G9S3E9_9MICO|nr:DoxX family protein [Leucobacter denitrificans]QNN62374.1 DoxX family protein [Leucobacter denitrificans]